MFKIHLPKRRKFNVRKLGTFIGSLAIFLAAVLLFYKFTSPVHADSYLSLNESTGTAVNDSQNNLSGTITNATWKNSDMCLTGSCLYFDGTGDYISFGDDADADFAASDNFTLSLWFRHAPISSGTQTLIAKYNSATGTDGGYKLYMESDGDITFGIDDDQTSFPEDSATSTAATYDDNQWHHVAAVKTGTSKIELFIDGTLVASDNSLSATGTLVNTDSLYIGIDGDGSSNGWAGYIDEVKILASAKTASTILPIMQKDSDNTGVSASFGPSTSYLSNGLLGYWQLEETSGNAADSSGNGLTLTNNGTTTYVPGKFGRGSEHVPASTQYLSTVTAINGIKTVSFWVNPDAATNYYINLTSTANIQSNSSGIISANGFTSPTIYVNGEISSTLTANTWSLVTVTTETAINADTFYAGRISTNYFDGTLDDIRLYNRTLTPLEISKLYTWAPGPVGYWKLDESSGNISDSSGNQTTLTNNQTATFTTGKYGNAAKFVRASSQFFSASDNAALSLTGSVTLAGWIKPSAITASTRFDIAGKWDSTYESYLLTQYGDEIRMYVGSSSNYVTTTATNLAVGTWYHIEGVYDASAQTVTIYVNGISQTTSTTGSIPSSISDTASEVHIGGSAGGGSGTINATVAGDTGNWGWDETTSSLQVVSAHILIGADWDGHASNLGALWNVTIPVGATITSAYVTLQAEGTGFGNATQLVVKGWDSATPSNPATYAAAEGATRTTNTVNWNETDWEWVDNTDYNSPSIVTIVQELVDTYDYSSGRNMSILVEDRASASNNFRYIATYGHSTTGAPRIHIEYTSGVNSVYDGLLDDIRIYSYPRSQAQVVQDMNAGHPAPGSPIGSVAAYWKLDGVTSTTAYDSGPNTQNLTLSGSPVFTTNGKFDHALDLESTSSQYLYVADSTALSITGDLTISAWIKPESNTATTLFPIAGKWDATYQDYLLAQYGDEIRMYIGSSSNYKTTDTVNLQIGTWYHVLGTYDASAQAVEIYVDGKLQASTTTGTIPTSITDNTGQFTVGASLSGSNYYDGILDEIKVYSSYLSATQVKAEFNHGASTVLGSLTTNATGVPDNSAAGAYCVPGDSTSCNPPVAHFKFDENTGTSTANSSGLTANGTLTAASWKQGTVGPAAYFPGVSNYLLVADDNDLDITSDITMEAWVFWEDGADDQEFIIFKQQLYDLRINTSGDAIEANYNGNDGSSHNYSSTTTAASIKNKWTHIAFTVGSTGYSTGYFYINGVRETASHSSFVQSQYLDAGLNVGGTNQGTSNDFKGIIDDVRIYNYVRTTAQVAWDYNRGSPYTWYKFDECQGAVAYDSSGKAINGTITPGDASGDNDTVGTCSSGTSTEMWNDGTNGKFNGSLGFDGTNDYVKNSTANYQSSSPEGTISVWINPTSYSGTSKYILSSADEASSNRILGLALNTSGNPYVYQQNADTYDAVRAEIVVPTGQWTHIVLISSGTAYTFYVNGKTYTQTVSSGSNAGDWFADTANRDNLTVGVLNWNSTYGQYFNGLIDDVRIYNYPLNITQIRDLMNAGSSVRFTQ